MGISVRSTSWARGASDAAISRVVGPASLARGRQYADAGAIQTLLERADGEVLLATVSGSGRSLYQTIVEVYASPPGSSPPAVGGVPRSGEISRTPLFGGRCSCPVSHNCKHVAAVVLAAREAAEQQTPRANWEEMLRPIVGTPTQATSPDKPGAALELSLVPGAPRARGAPAHRLEVRPLREGKTKRWVRSGATWQDLGGPWGHGVVREDHHHVITEILSLHRVSQGGHYYGYGHAAVLLDDLGPAIWPLLRRAVLLGMPLVAGRDLGSVRLLDGSAGLTLDVTRDAEGSLALRSHLRPQSDRPPDDPPAGRGVTPSPLDRPALAGMRLILGQPAHGVAVVDNDRGLQLVPLADTPSAALSHLAAANVLMVVPAGDVDRFLDLYYPGLSRQVAVESSDASVSFPAAVTPRLALDVAYAEHHHMAMRWGFVYARAGAEVTGTRVDFERSADDPPRDLEAEQRLLGSLVELAAMPMLQRATASGVWHPVASISLDGRDTATFSTEVLPQLERREDVLVTATGEPAAYAEAESAPTVHLQAIDVKTMGTEGIDTEGIDTEPVNVEPVSVEPVNVEPVNIVAPRSETEAGAAEGVRSDGGQGDWFDLQISVSIGGEHVPFAPLFTALTHGEDIMLLDSGTWFTLDRPELRTLRTLIDEARDLSDHDAETLRVSRYQVSLWEELVELGVVDQQSQRWSQAVQGLRDLSRLDPPPVPAGLAATLRPYQHEGFAWLCALWDAQLGAVLADDMGLGKTVQTLAMIQRAQERGELAHPVLVVAPASVVGTWVDEAGKFAPSLTVRAVTATQARRGRSIADVAAGAQLVVTSYTLLRLEDNAYQGVDWAGLVLDEAQFVKNYRSKTYQAVRRLGAPFTLAMTGTPLENSLMDLWSMLSLAAPGLFPKPEVFTQRYRKPIEDGTGPEQLAILRRRVRPFMLRRTKAEVAPELPDKQEQTLHIELSSAHRRIYQQHLQRERQRVMGLLEDLDRNRVAIFRALTALRQLALDPSLVDEAYAGKAASAKVEALIDHVRELAAEGHRALVFSSFTGFLKVVRTRLEEADIGYVYLDGRTRNRPDRIRAFREGSDPLFLISLKAGGFGLTLTEADYVFVLDPWWNPAAESQAIDRTHRIGQSRSVMVYRMVSADTIEDKVVALQERKRALFSTVIDDGDFTSASITADDIRGLLDG
ncbi:MAG: DEAD/DEAH box helicase [Ornithinimicrobium sp.]